VFSKIVWKNRRKVPAAAVRVEDPHRYTECANIKYVKAFESYRLTDRQTDTTERNWCLHDATWCKRWTVIEAIKFWWHMTMTFKLESWEVHMMKARRFILPSDTVYFYCWAIASLNLAFSLKRWRIHWVSWDKSSAIAEMAAQCCASQIFTVECRKYLSLTHSFFAISANIVISHVLSKTSSFGLHFLVDGSSFDLFDPDGPKSHQIR